MVNHIPSFGYGRCPEDEHWQSLDKLSDLLMEPEDFVKYWEITHRDLARIVGCSETTVSGWFCQTKKNQRFPNNYHRLRLAIVHKLWSKI